MKRNKLTYFLAATAILISILPIGSSPANSRPASKTLQSLPNGIYFYSTARLPRQGGSTYIVLLKRNNSFISSEYVYQSDGGCGTGTIRGNTLKHSRGYIGIDNEFNQSNSSTNLNEFYKLSSRDISHEDREGLKFCINTMSR